MDNLTRAFRCAMDLGYNEALVQNGLSDGTVSWSQARKVYGDWFYEAAKSGRLKPAYQRVAGGTKKYAVRDILALRAEDAAEAYILENN